MRTSVIPHSKSEQLVIIREDYLAICAGNHCAAAILNVFEYWTNVKIAHQSQAEALNSAAESAGDKPTQDTELWIYKSQKQLKDELLSAYGENKIGEALKMLQSLGYLETRTNPNYRWDKTIQYRLHIENVITALQNYADGVFIFKQSTSQNQRLETIKSKEAIPETTTETTTEEGEREQPPPQNENAIPSHMVAFENGLDAGKAAWLDTWRNAHQKHKPLPLRGRARGDALEQVDDLIEMGVTPEVLTRYIQSREKAGKSTDWRWLMTDIHAYLNQLEAEESARSFQAQGPDPTNPNAPFYDPGSDMTMQWNPETGIYDTQPGNTTKKEKQA